MKVGQVREINLRELLKRDSIKVLAAKADTNASYVSQILSDKDDAVIGTSLARRIENAYEKPEGWLDQLHVKINEETLTKIIVALEGYQAATGLKITPENKARYVALAYNRADEGDDFKLNELAIHLIAG